jgi:hypothetical protein
VLRILITVKHPSSLAGYEPLNFISNDKHANHRICGLVVSVEDYKHRDPGFDSRALLRIFLWELGLERGPLSLVIG